MTDTTEFRISLDDEDFQCLVSGGVLTINLKTGEKIKIALKDIGFNLMHEAIENVENGKINPYSDRDKNYG